MTLPGTAQSPPMRLGFISARSAFLDGDDIWVHSGAGRLLEAMLVQGADLNVAMCRAPVRESFHDHRLSLTPDRFVPLPEMSSMAHGFPKVWSCHPALREIERRSDALIVQLPFLAPLALLGLRRPRVFHMCLNVRSMATSSPNYKGVKRIPALCAAAVIDRIQSYLMHSPATRVVANGSELLSQYGNPPGRGVVSSSLQDREVMSVRRSRPPGAPLRVLYVGFLRLHKGIDLLITAFRRILAAHPDAELVIVGQPYNSLSGAALPFAAELAELVEIGTVRMLGHLAYGPELFQQFADADVLALPSRSEGTPRVLIEARAFGCPVVASDVDGIPSSVTHEVDGLMVPTDDADALTKALLRVLTDGELRARLVANGLDRARRSTVESYASAILEEATRVWQDNLPVETARTKVAPQ